MDIVRKKIIEILLNLFVSRYFKDQQSFDYLFWIFIYLFHSLQKKVTFCSILILYLFFLLYDSNAYIYYMHRTVAPIFHSFLVLVRFPFLRSNEAETIESKRKEKRKGHTIVSWEEIFDMHLAYFLTFSFANVLSILFLWMILNQNHGISRWSVLENKKINCPFFWYCLSWCMKSFRIMWLVMINTAVAVWQMSEC